MQSTNVMDEDAKATQETAKAVQEVAKATPAVIEAGTELARWVSGVLGTIPEDIVGLTFGDYLKELRTRNLDRLRRKTENIHRQRGIEQPEPIDPTPFQHSKQQAWRPTRSCRISGRTSLPMPWIL